MPTLPCCSARQCSPLIVSQLGALKFNNCKSQSKVLQLHKHGELLSHFLPPFPFQYCVWMITLIGYLSPHLLLPWLHLAVLCLPHPFSKVLGYLNSLKCIQWLPYPMENQTTRSKKAKQLLPKMLFENVACKSIK